MSSSDIKTVKLHRILSNAHFIGQSVWQKYSKIQTCVLMGAWRVKAGRWNSHTESSFCTSCQPTLFFNYCMWMLGRFHSGKGKVTLPESYKKWSNFVRGSDFLRAEFLTLPVLKTKFCKACSMLPFFAVCISCCVFCIWLWNSKCQISDIMLWGIR